jgi:hypothetical protein
MLEYLRLLDLPDFDRQLAHYYDREMKMLWLKENWDQIPKIESPHIDQIVIDRDLNYCCIYQVLDDGRRVAVFTMDKGMRKDRKPILTTNYRESEEITNAWANHVYPENHKKHV